MNAIAQRSLSQLLTDATSACERLAVASRSWSVFMPSTPQLDEVANTVEGLRRTLNELRPHAEQIRSPRAQR